MARERRSFTEEFKQEAVRRAAARDTTLAQVARELGIQANLLQTWRRKYAPQPKADAEVKLETSLEEENRRLRRENASLREDREILKKCAAFFAKESR
jgi:transposase